VSTGDPFDVDAYMDAVAGALALDIPAPYRPGVAANLARLAGFAAEVLAFEVPDGVAGDAPHPSSAPEVRGAER
jgi:hypothetical protein